MIAATWSWVISFTVALTDWSQAYEPTIHRSKAVGEPPLMLAMSTLHAIRDAVAACGPAGSIPDLPAPATPETVLRAIERIRIGFA